MRAAGAGQAASRFVGRVSELQLLDAELKRARSGDHRVVLIDGPAGMGKSSLLREFLDPLSDRIIGASGGEFESRLAYGVVQQLADASSAHGWPATLDISIGEDPLAVGAKVLDFIGVLEEDGPVIMVIDDAQWLDHPSAQALSFALRRLRADSVLALLAARDDPPAVWDILAGMASSGRGTRVSLGGLGLGDIRDLAEHYGTRGLPRRYLERFRNDTEGNPLHVRTLLEELDLDALTTGTMPLPAPRSFGLLVTNRLGECSAQGSRLVEAAAVLGEPSTLATVVRLAEIEDGPSALQEVVATGMLAPPRSLPVPHVVFSHPLVRSAVYGDMGPARRSALHLQAAALVGHPGALHHRIAAALVEDDALADEVEAYARAETAAGQLGSAADHLVAAARLTTSVAGRERMVLDAIDLLLRAGEMAEAAALAERTASFEDSPQRRCLLGNLAFIAGRQAAAEHLLIGACEDAERGEDSDLAARASAVLAHLYSIQMRWTECVDWARRSLRNTRGDFNLNVLAQAMLIIGPAMVGRADEGLRLAADMSTDVGENAGVGDVLTGRGMVRMWTDDGVHARDDLAAVVAASRPGLASPQGLIALGWLTEAEFRIGAWDDSAVHGALGVSLADTEQIWLATFVRAQAIWVVAARGDWDLAEDHAGSARAVAMSMGDAASAGYSAIAEAHLAFCRSQPERVIEAVQPFLDRPEWQAVLEPGVLPWREVYAWALVGMERLAEAAAMLIELQDLATAQHRRSALARAARVRAGLEAARGDAAAGPSFLEALAHLEGLPFPFERALTEEAYGRWLRRRGKRGDAAAHLEVAGEIFARLGAAPFAARTESELEACGVGKRGPAAGPRNLTTQELAVARLVVGGLTNRQVAQELVVSAKTVEYHLGHVYDKVGVTSRTQLAGRLNASPL